MTHPQLMMLVGALKKQKESWPVGLAPDSPFFRMVKDQQRPAVSIPNQGAGGRGHAQVTVLFCDIDGFEEPRFRLPTGLGRRFRLVLMW